MPYRVNGDLPWIISRVYLLLVALDRDSNEGTNVVFVFEVNLFSLFQRLQVNHLSHCLELPVAHRL